MWNPGWDKIFAENEWGKYPPEELIRFIARNFYKAGDRKKVRILEVGCGTGANLWYLAREGFRVSGIDASLVAIKRAMKRLESESLRATIKLGDIMKLPFKDNYFDCVIDNESIYANDFSDSRKIIKEIHRVLKKKGKFFSKTFMSGTSKNALKEGYGMIRFTREKEIPQLYRDFRIEAIDYVVRSSANRKYKIKEWLIACAKE